MVSDLPFRVDPSPAHYPASHPLVVSIVERRRSLALRSSASRLRFCASAAGAPCRGKFLPSLTVASSIFESPQEVRTR
jgi:hypothetical protein